TARECDRMTNADFLAARFEENRSHLRAVAYRMLGSLAEADDAVQESWLRLSRSDASAIDNLSGWLTTVVARVSLDMLRSRVSRREDSIDAEPAPERIAHTTAPDPEQEASWQTPSVSRSSSSSIALSPPSGSPSSCTMSSPCLSTRSRPSSTAL